MIQKSQDLKNTGIPVCHLSTAHGRREIRVHLKECNSLVNKAYKVFYIVSDGLGEEIIDSVQVLDIGRAGGRFKRMIIRPWMMYLQARKVRAKVYHFHDPELLLIAPLLLIGGAKVIYDSHEDIPRSLLTREWIPSIFKKPLSFTFEVFENTVSRMLSGIIGATPHIASRFKQINKNTIDINNFPLQSEIDNYCKISELRELNTERHESVCYIGGINKIRGIKEIISSMKYCNINLTLAGWFESKNVEDEATSTSGWEKVNYVGTVSRGEVSEILASSLAGLVIFHPVPNHINAQPNKIFEYMSAGIPVIASNFPLWKEIIESHNCGICVDPLDKNAIAEAITHLKNNPEKAKNMGRNGRDAVISKFNWSIEEQKLFDFYKELLER